MISKKRLYAMSIIPFAALVFLYHSTLISNAQAQEKPSAPRAQLLFFQHAESGNITPIKDSSSCYQIQLSHLNDRVIYFGNEPSRTTGVMKWSDFAVTWQHNETVDNIRPNAVIHALAAKKPVNDTVVLSNFTYDEKNNSGSYKACALDPKTKFATGQLTDVSVFIDPFHPWP